jgi:hypothetical protein
MFSALVLDWVGGEVNGTDVVTINNGGTAERAAKLTKQLSQPTGFSDAICHASILGLSTRTGHCCLTLGRPRFVTKEHSIPRGGAASVWTSCPVCIRVHCKIKRCTPRKVKTEVMAALQIPEDPLHSSEVRFSGVMHEQAHLLNSEGDVWMSESEVVQGSSNTTIVSRICHRCTVS